jgi:hypothetical protein
MHQISYVDSEFILPAVIYSGTILEAQKRYADGTKDCLIRFLDRRPIERDYLIV